MGILLIVVCLILQVTKAAFAMVNPEEIKILYIWGSSNTDPSSPLFNLSDGNSQTAWATKPTAPTDAWFELLLNESVFIDYIELEAVPSRTEEVTIEYADEDGRFYPFIGKRKIPLMSGKIDLSANGAKTQRIRFRLTNKTNQALLGNICEVRVYGHKYEELTKLSGKVVASNETVGYPGCFLSDNNTYTSWRTNYCGEISTITYNLNDVAKLRKVKFYNRKGSGFLTFSALVDDVWTSFGPRLDLTMLPNGWQSVDVPELMSKSIKIDIQGSTMDYIGGISEIEVWGDSNIEARRTYLLGDLLSGTAVKGIYIDDIMAFENAEILLMFPNLGMDPLPYEVKINGILLNNYHSCVANGYLQVRAKININVLRQGNNSITFNLGNNNVSEAYLIMDRNFGQTNVDSVFNGSNEIRNLNDGFCYSGCIVGEGEFVLNVKSPTTIDSIQVNSMNNANLNNITLSVWQNGYWLDIPKSSTLVTENTILILKGSPTTTKVRLQFGSIPIDGITEIQIKGSCENQSPPQINVLTPPMYSLIEAFDGAFIEGYIDNNDSALSIDEIPVTLTGHYFKFPIDILQTSTNSLRTVNFKASDSQGKTSMVSMVYLNSQSLSCDLPETSYVSNPLLIIQGDCKMANVIKINGMTILCNLGRYSTQIRLDQGENLITIEAIGAGNNVMRIERRVTLDNKAPEVQVNCISGIVVKKANYVINGTCSDLSPTKIWINGEPVSLSQSKFSKPLNLIPGDNTIKITAIDELGNKNEVDCVINYEQPMKSMAFAAYAVSNEEPEVTDYESLVNTYSIPSLEAANEKSNYASYFLNNQESVNPSSGHLNITAADLILPGRNGFDLVIQRIYDSGYAKNEQIIDGNTKAKRDIPVLMFKNGWSLNIPWVETLDSKKYIRLANGTTLPFTQSFTHHEGIHFNLQVISSGYVLTMRDGTVYELDSRGRPTIKKSADGKNTIRYEYATSNPTELSKIIDSLGREVTFVYGTYNNKRQIAGIAYAKGLPHEREVVYSYNSSGLLSESLYFTEKNTNGIKQYRKTLYSYVPIQIKVGTVISGKDEIWYYEDYWYGPEVGPCYGGTQDLKPYQNVYDIQAFFLNQIEYPTKTTVKYEYQSFSQDTVSTWNKSYSTGWFYAGGDRYRKEEHDINYTGNYYNQSVIVVGQQINGKITRFSPVFYDKNEGSFKYDSFVPRNSYLLSNTIEERENGSLVRRVIENYSFIKKGNEFILTNTTAGLHKSYYRGSVVTSRMIDYVRPGSTIPVTYQRTNYAYKLDIQEIISEKAYAQNGIELFEVIYDYDAWGNTISMKDSRTGLEKNITYYNHATIRDQPLKAVVKNKNVLTGQFSLVTTDYTYYTDGKLQSMSIDGGMGPQKSQYFYDSYGNLQTSKDPNELLTTYDYDPIYHAFPVKKTITGVKDADDRTLPDIITQVGYYIELGLKKWEMNPKGYVTWYEYDRLNRATKIILPDDDDVADITATPSSYGANNPYRTYLFDDLANTCTFVNEKGQKTVYAFDGLGRVKQVKQYLGENALTTNYIYNAFGQVVSIEDPRGVKTSSISDDFTTWYEYDGLGRLTKITYPYEPGQTKANSPFTTLSYNDQANAVEITNENGVKVVKEVKDWAGRLVKAEQYSNFTGEITQTYAWDFTHDSIGNKLRQINPDKSQIDWNYSSLGQVLQIKLPEMALVLPGTNNPQNYRPIYSYVYDASGNRIQDTNPNGTALQNPGNHKVDYTYDKLGRIIKTTQYATKTDPITKQSSTVSMTTIHYYDNVGNKVKTIDGNGKTWECGYSARGFLLWEKDPLGQTRHYRYDALGNKIAEIDPRGNGVDGQFTTWYVYDDLNRLVRTVLPDNTPPEDPYMAQPTFDNPYTEISYDEIGNKKKERDANGVTTTYEYTSRNWLKRVSHGGQEQAVYEYDRVGNKIYDKIPTGNNNYAVTEYQYDSLGRQRRIIHPAINGIQQKENIQYDYAGRRIGFTDGRNNLTQYTYNAMGWLSQVTDALNHATTYAYDPNGNQVKITAANNLVTYQRYDELNRLIDYEDSLGQHTYYTYDKNGNRESMQDVRGTLWRYTYFDNNLLQKVLLNGANATYSVNYSYDAAGNRIEVSDDKTTIKYNNFDNNYVSDPMNRINSVERSFDGASYRTEYKYNVGGALEKIKYPEANSWIEYQYDQNNRLQNVVGYASNFAYNPAGGLEGFTLANGVVASYGYDPLLRLNAIQYKKTDAISVFSSTFTYDLSNNIATIDGGRKYFGYDANNQLIRATEKGNFVAKDNTAIPGYRRGDYISQKGLDFGVDLQAIIKLDFDASSIGLDFGQPTSVKTIRLIPGENHTTHRLTDHAIDLYVSDDNQTYTLVPVQEWTSSKDNNGLITITMSSQRSSRYLKLHVKYDERDAEFQHVDRTQFLNELGKMLEVIVEANEKSDCYEYDDAGNRRSYKLIINRPIESYDSFYYNNSNRLKTDGKNAFAYDKAGNMIKKGNRFTIYDDMVTFTTSGEGVEYWEYEYDLMNRLTKVLHNGAVAAEYAYDPEGLRVVKRAKGQTTHYIFEGTEPIFEKNITTNKRRSYIYALGKHLARVDGVIGSTEPVYYYHTDHLGSIRAITDGQGAIVWSADYQAFGAQTGQEGTLQEFHGFTGKEYDPDTGLYYYNARWYDAELGRFISEDPAADPNNPNLYSYCGNNPLNAVDPTGMWEDDSNYPFSLSAGLDFSLDLMWDWTKKGFNWMGENVERTLNGIQGYGFKTCNELAEVLNSDGKFGWANWDKELSYNVFQRFIEADIEGLTLKEISVFKDKVLREEVKKLRAKYHYQYAGFGPASKRLAPLWNDELFFELSPSEEIINAAESGLKLGFNVGLVSSAFEMGFQFNRVNIVTRATQNKDSSTVILGKYSEKGLSYEKVARNKGATYFYLEDYDDLFRVLGEKNMKEINRLFIEQQWKSGKTFYLTHDPWKATRSFQDEILWLIELGAKDFKPVGNLWKVIR